MAQYLVDTNLLVRVFEPSSSGLAEKSIALLLEAGHQLYVAPQVIIEFWWVTTRPSEVNGLGWDVEKVTEHINEILTWLELIDDCPEVFDHWFMLVQKYEVKGKRTHDVRLVAAMLENGVDKLLTFNTGDFEAFTEIKVIHPANVVANAT